MPDRELTAEENEKMQAMVNRSLDDAKPVKKPELWLTAGQPAAGKSVIARKADAHFKDKGGYVTINVDDYREFDPRYRDFQKQDDKTAAGRVQAQVKKNAAVLYAEALKQNKNILIDQSSKNPASTAKKIEQAKAAGYERFELHAIATKSEISWMQNHARYEHQKASSPTGFGRYVPKDVHDAAFNNFPDTVKHLESEKLVDKVTVYENRQVIYENEIKDKEWQQQPQAKADIKQAHARSLSQTEFLQQYQAWRDIQDKMNNRTKAPASEKEKYTVEQYRVSTMNVLINESFNGQPTKEVRQQMEAIDKNFNERKNEQAQELVYRADLASRIDQANKNAFNDAQQKGGKPKRIDMKEAMADFDKAASPKEAHKTISEKHGVGGHSIDNELKNIARENVFKENLAKRGETPERALTQKDNYVTQLNTSIERNAEHFSNKDKAAIAQSIDQLTKPIENNIRQEQSKQASSGLSQNKADKALAAAAATKAAKATEMEARDKQKTEIAKPGRIYTGNIVEINNDQTIQKTPTGKTIIHETENMPGIKKDDVGQKLKISYASGSQEADIKRRDDKAVQKENELAANKDKDRGMER